MSYSVAIMIERWKISVILFLKTLRWMRCCQS